MMPLCLVEAPQHSLGALLVLAIVQGLTEFLPVSSSGHLVLSQALLGFTEPALAVVVALHLGTLVAVVGVYRIQLVQLVGRMFQLDLWEFLALGIGTLPAALVGILLGDAIEGAFGSPLFAGCGLLVTAVVLLIGERSRRLSVVRDEQGNCSAGGRSRVSCTDALWIGCAQAMAILPGVSRSGSTIAVGLSRGLSTETSATFSFLLSIPVIAGAALLKAPQMMEGGGTGATQLITAVLVAALVGWGALRLLLAFLSRGAFRWFAGYCALVGLAAIGIALL